MSENEAVIMYSSSLVLLSHGYISAYMTDQQLTLDIQINLFPGHMRARLALHVQINIIKYKCMLESGR